MRTLAPGLAVLCLGAGCEIGIPLIVAGTNPPEPEPSPGFESSSMTLELAEADGYLIDEPVSGLAFTTPVELEPMSGFLFLGVSGHPSIRTLHVETCDLGSAFEDPYGGLDQPIPEPIDGGVPADRGFATPCGPTEDLVQACGDDPECARPQSARFARTNTADGVEIAIELDWDSEHPMYLRFVEVR